MCAAFTLRLRLFVFDARLCTIAQSAARLCTLIAGNIRLGRRDCDLRVVHDRRSRRPCIPAWTLALTSAQGPAQKYRKANDHEAQHKASTLVRSRALPGVQPWREAAGCYTSRADFSIGLFCDLRGGGKTPFGKLDVISDPLAETLQGQQVAGAECLRPRRKSLDDCDQGFPLSRTGTIMKDRMPKLRQDAESNRGSASTSWQHCEAPSRQKLSARPRHSLR